MTNLMDTLKEIQNKYQYLGIRGTEEELQIGEELGTSYDWNHNEDRTTFGYEDETELGGVCTTLVTDELENENENEDELLNKIEEIKTFHKKYYGRQYTKIYLVASNLRNPNYFEEYDENEAILANAVVIAKL